MTLLHESVEPSHLFALSLSLSIWPHPFFLLPSCSSAMLTHKLGPPGGSLSLALLVQISAKGKSLEARQVSVCIQWRCRLLSNSRRDVYKERANVNPNLNRLIKWAHKGSARQRRGGERAR